MATVTWTNPQTEKIGKIKGEYEKRERERLKATGLTWESVSGCPLAGVRCGVVSCWLRLLINALLKHDRNIARDHASFTGRACGDSLCSL